MRAASSPERQRRRLRVLALRGAGFSFAAIAARTGLSRTGVFNIWRRIDDVYLSADQGTTWAARGAPDAWTGVASSADGMRLAVVSNLFGSGEVWVSAPAHPAATTLVSGSLSGVQYQAIELQYIGGDRFIVLDAIGTGFAVQ